jgi:hypothetical protein
LRKVNSLNVTNGCQRYVLHLVSKHTHFSFPTVRQRASAMAGLD